MSYHNKWKIKHRIAAGGYSVSEARFISIADYILHLHKTEASEEMMVEALDRYYTEAFNKGFDKAEGGESDD